MHARRVRLIHLVVLGLVDDLGDTLVFSRGSGSIDHCVFLVGQARDKGVQVRICQPSAPQIPTSE